MFKQTKIRIIQQTQKPDYRLAIAERDLVQIMLNLFINARDAMPQGGHLTVSSEKDGDCCKITLEDTGKGIPKRVLTQIFSPFFTTKGAKGTGLGLSVTESLIRHCGGSIEVESESEKGTKFCLFIPLWMPGRSSKL